jgi:hypothetical protein
MTQAHATYATKHWDRKPWSSEPAAETTPIKLGRVEMVHTFQGDIEGEGILQYLFAYNPAGDGGFVALEKITGSVGGKSGSFVLQCIGTASHGRLRQTLVVVPGSGTGELSGLRGQATMDCDLHMDHYPITFEYEF